ncbi:hypothetical protein [Clostridium paraputrificum]|uniref:Uncharacterized protein n=1 Tax=Clostridium paraputrificum TaxID=29363 RepID=A0A6N3F998_9CLOT
MGVKVIPYICLDKVKARQLHRILDEYRDNLLLVWDENKSKVYAQCFIEYYQFIKEVTADTKFSFTRQEVFLVLADIMTNKLKGKCTLVSESTIYYFEFKKSILHKVMGRMRKWRKL